MHTDPIIEELHRIREELAAKHNYDVHAIVAEIRNQQQAEDKQVVSLPPKLANAAASPVIEEEGCVSEPSDREKPSIDIGSFIERTPGVVGGRPRIAGTRVPVQSIAICYKQGDSPEEIAFHYGHLSVAQVYAALTYYHANRDEIEAEIAAEAEFYDRLARRR
jgi:uncharacterized protein (DUF433 family)